MMSRFNEEATNIPNGTQFRRPQTYRESSSVEISTKKSDFSSVRRFEMAEDITMASLMEGWLKSKKKVHRGNGESSWKKMVSSKKGVDSTFPPRKESTRSTRTAIKDIFWNSPRKEGLMKSSSHDAESPLSQSNTKDEVPSLWDTLEDAVEQDVFKDKLSWHQLLSLHRSESSGGSVQSDDSYGSGVEVTVNSGGIVYFAIFNQSNEQQQDTESIGPSLGDSGMDPDPHPIMSPKPVTHHVKSLIEPKFSAICIKFTSNRLSTQSEFLGSELARHLGVYTPNSRLVHSGSVEWDEIAAAVTTAENYWREVGDEAAAAVCEEMSEGLRLSRSLLLMGYVHGRSLMESTEAFSIEAAEKTATELGRVFLLDMVLRNGDRLACKRLGWRGNLNNIMFTHRKIISPTKEDPQKKEVKTQPQTARRPGKSPGRSPMQAPAQPKLKPTPCSLHFTGNVIVIDSGVSRRPPSMQTSLDRTEYPVLVELLLNDQEYAGEILHEISNGHFSDFVGAYSPRRTTFVGSNLDAYRVVSAFQRGFKCGIEDLESLQVMLSTLRRRLDEMLRAFIAYIATTRPDSMDDGSSPGSKDRKKKKPPTPRSRMVATEPRHVRRKSGSRENLNFEVWPEKKTSPKNRRWSTGTTADETAQHTPQKSGKCSPKSIQSVCQPEVLDASTNTKSSSARKVMELLMSDESNLTPLEGSVASPDIPFKQSMSMNDVTPTKDDDENVAQYQESISIGKKKPASGQKWYKNMRNLPLRLTLKIKSVRKSVKGDEELVEQLEWWDGKIREEGLKICEPHNFCTGFLETSGGHSLVDSYELKIRLEHILERVSLIVDASATRRPSEVIEGVFIGGVLAAKSRATLERVGITHVLSLCPLDVFDLTNQFAANQVKHMLKPLRDVESEEIEYHFRDTCRFIDLALLKGGKVLVHCFEGKSRSAAILLAFLMLARHMTLKEAWTLLKQTHSDARPNDGFMSALVSLDKELNGGVASMEWKNRKPLARFCTTCQKMVGFSSDSLRAHMRSKHPKDQMEQKDPLLALDLDKMTEQLETSLEIEMQKSSSPNDVAKRQLMAIVGIGDS